MSQTFENERQITGDSEPNLVIILAKLKVVYISVCALSGIFERKMTIIKFGLAYVSKPVFLIVVPSVGFGTRLGDGL
jgi:hypothetical protein